MLHHLKLYIHVLHHIPIISLLLWWKFPIFATKTNSVPFSLQRLSFIVPFKKFLSYTTFQPKFFPLVKHYMAMKIFLFQQKKNFFTSFCMNEETFSCDTKFSPLCYVTHIVVFYMIHQVVNKNNTCNIIAVTHYMLLKKNLQN